MSKSNPVFSAFADSRTGNRGAVSMLESAIDHLTDEAHPGVVNVFSVYPKADKKLPQTPRVNLYNGTPLNLVTKLIPLSILYRLGRALGISFKPGAFGAAMQALLDTDVCLMIGGTTFSDAQLFKVPYNVACLLPAIILGKKAIMYSQTLGPFKNPLNRWAARWSLSHMDFVVPRGPGSLANVRSLNLPCPVEYFADSAFTLVVPPDVEQAIHQKYDPILAGKKVVGISVNTIVQEKCEKIGIDHNGAWVTLIEYLQAQGYFILMVPHSMRPGSKSRHNNDLLLVDEILSSLKSQDNILVVNEPYNCKELRVVVGLADYYIASRFHSMISALCTKTPVSVFGWGYQKYHEVLEDFELEAYCHDAHELSGEALIAGFEVVVRDADEIRKRMERNLPKVQQSSMQNHQTSWKLAVD